MTETNNQHVKILFRFYSDVLDQWTVETMWAEIIDKEKGLYRIDNIPFYASVASSDFVFAEYDETEEFLTYRETVEYSENSVVQVIMQDDSFAINDIREIFENMGCPSERLNDGYFVMEIPAVLDYAPVKKKLSELAEKEIIGYAEPVLGSRHQF